MRKAIENRLFCNYKLIYLYFDNKKTNMDFQEKLKYHCVEKFTEKTKNETNTYNRWCWIYWK